nr:hypothetical protein [Nonomuraea basaltis]
MTRHLISATVSWIMPGSLVGPGGGAAWVSVRRRAAAALAAQMARAAMTSTV